MNAVRTWKELKTMAITKLKAFEAQAEVNGVMRAIEFKEVEGAYGKGRLTIHGLTLEETHVLLDGMALGHVEAVAPSKGRGPITMEEAAATVKRAAEASNAARAIAAAQGAGADPLEAAKIDGPAPAAAGGGAADTAAPAAPTRRRRASAASTDTPPADAGAEAVKAGQQAAQAAAQGAQAPAPEAQASAAATPPPPPAAAPTRKLAIVDQNEDEDEEAAKARAAGKGQPAQVDLVAECQKATKLIDVLKTLAEKGGVSVDDNEAMVAKCEELKSQVPLLGRIGTLPDRVKRTLEILREES